MPRSSTSRRAGPPAITYYPLVLLLAALALGIVLDRVQPLWVFGWWMLSVGALIGWLPLAWTRRESLASMALLVSVLAAGGAWHHGYWRLYPEREVSRLVDEIVRPMVVEAYAITSPRWVPAPPPTALRTIPKGDECEMLLWIVAVRDGTAFRPASGWATLQVQGMLKEVRPGDRLRVMAQAAKPAAPLNPGEFDFSEHERARRVGCRMFAEFPESVEKLSVGPRWSLRRWLADLRSGGTVVLARYIAPERAKLASAILLGTRELLDADRNEGYLVTGTIHVLSTSGLHVGILAAGFFLVLRTGLAPRRLTLLATMLLTIGYAIFIELDPPVVRATILVVMGCVALWLGRTAIGFNTLAGAGILVLALNPASLFQVGPLLSFLAVATMIAFHLLLGPQFIADPLDRLVARTRPWPVRAARQFGGFAWRLWLTGALIWLTSTPLVWRQYQLVSPVALVANFCMWLPVIVAMYAGLGTLVLGPLFPLAGRICGVTCDSTLEFLEKLIAWCRGWPGSYFWLAAPPGWWIGLFYVAIGVAVVVPIWMPPRRWCVALAAVWLAGALFLSSSGGGLPLGTRRESLTCHFVAVGHGICTLIELPDGKNLLYDAGRLGSPLSGVRPISAVLWSRGIKRLDAIVISHADADHFNAIPDLLDRFSVGAIYVSPVMFNRMPPAVAELSQAIERYHVPIRQLFGGQRLAAGGGTVLEVLHPPAGGILGSDNANSIVLKIEHAGKRLLLTGDLEGPGLVDVLAEEPLDCDVVLAPHHGSPRSDPGGTVPLKPHSRI